jgi:hypothetical protein
LYNFESRKTTKLNSMKKFLTAMSLVLGLGLATAQQTTPATSTTNTRPVAKTTKTVKTTTADSKSAKPASTTTGVKMKKDGTPDKRYKTSQHLKKDGTPDKRYKENK